VCSAPARSAAGEWPPSAPGLATLTGARAGRVPTGAARPSALLDAPERAGRRLPGAPAPPPRGRRDARLGDVGLAPAGVVGGVLAEHDLGRRVDHLLHHLGQLQHGELGRVADVERARVRAVHDAHHACRRAARAAAHGPRGAAGRAPASARPRTQRDAVQAGRAAAGGQAPSASRPLLFHYARRCPTSGTLC